MERTRLIRPVEIAGWWLTAFFVASVSAYPQSPPARERQAQQTNPASTPAALNQSAQGVDGLREQIQELSTALRQMHDDLEAARGEARQLKQELENTKGQVTAIQTALRAAHAQPATEGAVAAVRSEPPRHQEERQSQGRTWSPRAAALQIEQRVAKVEEDQQLLSAKIDDQYQTKVESGSKYRVKLSGMALLNAFSTRGNVDISDLPQFATPPDFTDSNSGFGATLRQSIIGLDVYGPEIAGAKSSGDIRADFFGGFPNTPDGVASPLFRLRTGGMRLDWQDTSLVIGQYAPFISPLSPSSLASVAYPAFASAGNLWVWTPEIYVEHRVALSKGSDVTLQGGIMDPLTGEAPPDSYYREPTAGERAGQPAYAARIAWAYGQGQSRYSIGVGGYYARQNWKPVRTVHAWAGTVDWSAPLGGLFSLTGEFYRGQAIGGLGAGEGRSVVYIPTYSTPWSDVAVPDSTGGWAQLKFTPSERVEFNGAFGEDFTPFGARPQPYPPRYANSGLPVGRNQSLSLNTIYHVRSNVLLSVEYHRLRTSESLPGVLRANQLTFSAATLY